MLSLIVTPEKQDGRTRLKKVLRDVSEDEFAALLMKHGCDPAIATERTNYEEERGKISVIAPVKCNPKTPKSMAFKVGSQKIQYRGPIIVAGTGDGADDRILPKAFYKGLKAEVTYGDNAICLPSIAEWRSLPEALADRLRSRNWVWLRDTGTDHQVYTAGNLAVFGGIDLVDGTTDNGGIVAFVNLKKLPKETADKIRASDSVNFGRSSYRVWLHRITDDIYAIDAVNRRVPGLPQQWQPFYKDTTKEDCYDNSFIRKHLNEEYLPKLIEVINKEERS